MTFVSRQQVRFAHVDAAGIVFYPRYFEMLNAAVEDYFAEVVGVGFAEMHGQRRLGVPTVRLETDFAAPSRLGDLLDFELRVTAVGRSSLGLSVAVRCGADVRISMSVTLVCMDLDAGRALPWPDDMRSAIAA
ncbi:acyl-CoA thioesterase [Rhizorhabdus wittichii]|uniref:Thioesterase superfamily protein n=2 Tax=Rhizorhabdus wittichii TaxID=160791 RepID=A0A9J9LCZ9_RHIWR|nr:thioesterase family protein [Rhizorhabdus wittichii]ABQ67188.1 thioesterase superfamily protein [Rhizorhabdus wittichii RW1]ARR56038.1 thioesterase [Rhizorhabdus wittichii DC-6]QTH23189.1 acyl-CoA thioesterase [Rhizorhabdus wittichii]